MLIALVNSLILRSWLVKAIDLCRIAVKVANWDWWPVPWPWAAAFVISNLGLRGTKLTSLAVNRLFLK